VQFLRNLIEKQKKLYHAPDSKFHKLWPLFDAFETFLFAPEHRAGNSRVHVRDYVDLKRVMNTVILAMLPCLLWAIWNAGAQHFHAIEALTKAGKITSEGYVHGWLQALFAPNVAAPSAFDNVIFGLQRMLPILIVSYGVGLGIEMVFSVIRKEEVSEGYLVSGMLIALIVPASIPLWQLAIGVAFAVVLGKEVFGGTGMNIFNPAMLVRAFLFFAFAAQMSGDMVWVAGNQSPVGVPGSLIDGFSQPTALAVVKQASSRQRAARHWPPTATALQPREPVLRQHPRQRRRDEQAGRAARRVLAGLHRRRQLAHDARRRARPAGQRVPDEDAERCHDRARSRSRRTSTCCAAASCSASSTWRPIRSARRRPTSASGSTAP
jgi:Na(+)-translocating NADH:ubiquinone oxidoreductase B subunit